MKQRLGFFVRLAFIAILVFLLIVMIQINIQINDLKKEYDSVATRLREQNDAIDRVREELDAPYSEETIRRIAREELNLSSPGDILYESDSPN